MTFYFILKSLPCNTEQLPSNITDGRFWSKLCLGLTDHKSAEACSRGATGYKENTPFSGIVRGNVFVHIQPFMATSTELHFVLHKRTREK